MSRLPLEGIRICDLSTVWSGPLCCAYLGGMGAEVIKIESIQHPDSFRFGNQIFENSWEMYGPWNCTNINKYGITIDLNNAKGIDLFKKLVSVSDIVLENYTTRVMKNFNLTYPVLKDIKSDLIMVSIPGYGTTGPWQDHAGYGVAFEQTSGIAYVTGYNDGPPQSMGGSADPIVGMHAAFAILLALEYRRRTKEGQYIDFSQIETLTSLLGVPMLDFGVNHRIWGRTGNRDNVMAPNGAYPCKGNDKWLAIAVSSEDEWKSFCQVIGKKELIGDERFSSLPARHRNHDMLDKIISDWTLEHDYYEAMVVLQDAGVAAGAVLLPHALDQEPQFKERGFFQELSRELVGTQVYPTWPFRFSETPFTMRPAPKLGEHNEYVFKSILGLSTTEIGELEKEQIIGKKPLGLGDIITA